MTGEYNGIDRNDTILIQDKKAHRNSRVKNSHAFQGVPNYFFLHI